MLIFRLIQDGSACRRIEMGLKILVVVVTSNRHLSGYDYTDHITDHVLVWITFTENRQEYIQVVEGVNRLIEQSLLLLP